ncbi:MAG: hypothetical protein PHP86_19050 [Nevskiales bacterium]|nr:hypothetical protein [Nevskiales bacterium]
MRISTAIGRLLLAACALLAWSATSAQNAETAIAVIVNPNSGVTRLDRNDAINIFMGRYRKLPSGLIAFPIDIGEHSEERAMFYRRLLDKDLDDIDAYWSRLVFSGQTPPPMIVPDARTAVELVAGNRAAIAYVPAQAVDARVRVVLELGKIPP